MKIFVTGSAGFIGFHVSKILLERGDTVLGMDDFNDYYDPALKEARNAMLEKYPNYQLHRGDIRDQKAVEKIFSEYHPDAVCHLAARAGVRASLENPRIYIDTNIVGTFNILEAAKKQGIERIVLASTSSVYGGNTKLPFSEDDPVETPLSPYAASKRSTELLAYTYSHLYHLPTICLRFFTVYGPWGRPDMALFKFTRLILDNKPIPVYNYGEHRRDFTYVDDIARGVVAALDTPMVFEIINLGNNHPEKLLTFIEHIEKNLGKKSERNLMPLQEGDVKETYADISKAQKLLGFEPRVMIEEGIQNFIDWFKKYYNV